MTKQEWIDQAKVYEGYAAEHDARADRAEKQRHPTEPAEQRTQARLWREAADRARVEAERLTPEQIQAGIKAGREAIHATCQHLENEVTRLTEDRAALVEQAAYYKREAERLTAENERLRAEASEADKASLYSAQREQAAEARLATAVGLLRWLDQKGGLGLDVHERLTAYFASAQPAATDPSDACRYDTSTVAQPAAPARTEAERTDYTPFEAYNAKVDAFIVGGRRTEAEQAVLDAFGAIPEDDIQLALDLRDGMSGAERRAWRAELARREAAK